MYYYMACGFPCASLHSHVKFNENSTTYTSACNNALHLVNTHSYYYYNKIAIGLIPTTCYGYGHHTYTYSLLDSETGTRLLCGSILCGHARNQLCLGKIHSSSGEVRRGNFVRSQPPRHTSGQFGQTLSHAMYMWMFP